MTDLDPQEERLPGVDINIDMGSSLARSPPLRNHVRITTGGKIRNYVSYIHSILGLGKQVGDPNRVVDSVTIVGEAGVLQKTISVAEIVKRTAAPLVLYQITSLQRPPAWIKNNTPNMHADASERHQNDNQVENEKQDDHQEEHSIDCNPTRPRSNTKSAIAKKNKRNKSYPYAINIILSTKALDHPYAQITHINATDQKAFHQKTDSSSVMSTLDWKDLMRALEQD